MRLDVTGLSADTIVDEYPHLRLEQVHNALSYYDEHKFSSTKRKDDQALLSSLKKKFPSKMKIMII